MIGIKLAYYRESDWNRFVKMIEDRESMHHSWEGCHNDFLKTKRNLVLKGFEVVDVVVDLDKLKEYCTMKRIKNYDRARS